VLESAFNIVYGLPNRPFLHGKGLATLFMAGSLIVLFAALVVGSIGFDLLRRFAPGFVSNPVAAYALPVLISTCAVFVFLAIAYERLTNADLSFRDVWPGAAIGAALLQLTFQVLPIFVRVTNEVVAVQALGASALLLVWIYVMANAIVFGAEINWWRQERRRHEEIRGLA
jgi:membrane protein